MSVYIDNQREFFSLESDKKTLEYIADNEKLHLLNNTDYISLVNKGKYGLIDTTGNIVIDFISSSLIKYNYEKNLFIIQKEDELYYLINSDMKIISDGYEHMEFLEESEYISVYEDDFIDDNHNTNDYKYGLIDKEGNLVEEIIHEKQDEIQF